MNEWIFESKGIKFVDLCYLCTNKLVNNNFKICNYNTLNANDFKKGHKQ